MMKSVGLFQALPIESPESLIDRDIPIPAPSPSDILVEVEAISVNPADCRVRARKEKDGEFAILGWDVAGRVVGVGEGVTEYTIGDSIFYAGDLTRPGANSEFHLVNTSLVAHRPKSLMAAEAAVLPLTALTAWEALFERMCLSLNALSKKQLLLIVGGAGGVGSMAIQLAKLIPNLTVVATASRPESQNWCQGLGADVVINHFGDMKSQLKKHGYSSVDLILLLNDPDNHYPTLADILAPQGKLCSVVPFTQQPDLNLLMKKSASFLWEFMFTRSMFATTDMSKQGEILKQVSALIDEGKLITTLSETLGSINSHNLREAHKRIESGRTLGKLALAGF